MVRYSSSVAPIAGCWSWPERYTDLIKKKNRLVIGYDNDAAGNEAAIFFFRLLPHVKRLPLPEEQDIGEAWLMNPNLFEGLK